MTFAWPAGLLLLALVPLGIALDRWIARRRARALVGFAHPAPAATGGTRARDRGRSWRRRVPALVTVAGFVLLTVGLARPQVALSAPRLEGTVILAFDVSASMAATDYAPTRMEAAKAAATAFVQRQPASVQIGVVAFSDAGIAVQQATSDQASVLDAIARLQPQRGTSLGAGILAAIRAVDSAENPNQGYYTNRSPDPSPPAVPPGSHTSAIVVLLSDGENNEAPDVVAAAQVAADRGIRVDTVGIGSVAGTNVDLGGFKVHTALDEATLQSIADTTKGSYVGAPDAGRLEAAYDAVDASLVVTASRPTEVTALFALIGLAALVAGMLGSLAWLGAGAVTLLWPLSLVLLAAIPAIVATYAWGLRRHRPAAVRYSSLELVRASVSRWSRIRRHLPFALAVVALVSLAVAAARPAAIVSIPTNQITIILAIDVSGSMCSTDIPPSRLLAAENAAAQFVAEQPGAQVGIVAFSGFAELVQAPSSDGELVDDAIRSLTTGRRTAIGSGILAAIDAIAEVDPNVAKSQADPNAPSGIQPVPAGDYAPEIVVLLTDGASNAGPDPLAAAQEAADRGVRVYTIGFGTAQGAAFDPTCAAQFIGREPGNQGGGFGGGGFGGGGGFRRGIDEATLQGIASRTGASYYSAESAGQLQTVFAGLPTNLVTKHDVVELSAAFLAAGAALAAVAYLLARAWRPLPGG